MIVTTFNGCKIKVRKGRGAQWGTMAASVNGHPITVVRKHDEAEAVAEIKRLLAPIHDAPIDGDRWPAYLYPPGTYELCAEGIHPREIGGQCTHRTCQPGWGTR